MILVVQRVSRASVKVEGVTVGKIGKGFMVLVGIKNGDDEAVAAKMVKKMCGLRIFEDAEGKTNLSLADVGGELLLISQFTLCADCRKGYRPSFIDAARPEVSEPLYNFVIDESKKYVPVVEKGVFGAMMEVELINDGPFTIVLDSEK